MRVYTIIHSQQSDQGLHYLPFSAVWSGSTLFTILSKPYYLGLHCFPFLAVWPGSTLFVILSLIRVNTIWDSQQSDKFPQYLPFFPSRIIKVLTFCLSQQSDQGLHYLPFSAVWSGSTLFASLSKPYYPGLHCMPFSGVWPGSTLFVILSLIRVNTICHSQQSNQGLQYLPFFPNSIIKVYTVCLSQWSDKGLHYLPGERGGSVVECRTPEREVRGWRPTAAVLCPWARHFTPRKYWLITQEAVAPSRHDWKIVDRDVKPQHKQTKQTNSSLIRDYTIYHSQSAQGLHYLPLAAV